MTIAYEEGARVAVGDRIGTVLACETYRVRVKFEGDDAVEHFHPNFVHHAKTPKQKDLRHE